MVKCWSCQHPMITIFICTCFLLVPMLVTLGNHQGGILMTCHSMIRESLDMSENGTWDWKKEWSNSESREMKNKKSYCKLVFRLRQEVRSSYEILEPKLKLISYWEWIHIKWEHHTMIRLRQMTGQWRVTWMILVVPCKLHMMISWLMTSISLTMMKMKQMAAWQLGMQANTFLTNLRNKKSKCMEPMTLDKLLDGSWHTNREDQTKKNNLNYWTSRRRLWPISGKTINPIGIKASHLIENILIKFNIIQLLKEEKLSRLYIVSIKH